MPCSPVTAKKEMNQRLSTLIVLGVFPRDYPLIHLSHITFETWNTQEAIISLQKNNAWEQHAI